MKIKSIIVALLLLLLLMPAVAFAQTQSLKTNLNGDVKLDLSLEPSVEVSKDFILGTGLNPSILQLNAHFKGSTDAINMEFFAYGKEQSTIAVDESGVFEITLNLPVSCSKVKSDFDGSTLITDITFPDIYVVAGKGENWDVTKYAGTKLDKSIPFNDGILNSNDFSLLNKRLAELSIPYTQGINQNLSKEWVASYYSVTGSVYDENIGFMGQLHYKGTTDADNLIIRYPGEGTFEEKKIDINPGGTYEGIININGSYDKELLGGGGYLYVEIKAVKGNNEVVSSKRLGPLNRSRTLYIGDINDDGKINSIDYVLVKKYISGMIDKFPLETGFFCADVNDDRKINSADASYIKRYILGIINTFAKKDINIVTGNID
ncbi:MAG TPA: dockerin type I repeat-containing protein [Clostridia bacterium]